MYMLILLFDYKKSAQQFRNDIKADYSPVFVIDTKALRLQRYLGITIDRLIIFTEVLTSVTSFHQVLSFGQ